MADTKRRSARVLAERKRSIYFEPASDDDFEGEDSEGEQEFAAGRDPSPGPSRPQRPRKKRKIDRRPKPETRAKEKRRKRFKGRKTNEPSKKHGINWIASPASNKKSESSRGFTGPSDGVVPRWASLPPEIWRDIFIFASQPIHEQTTTAIANVSWLMHSARICRSLLIPALEAYYQSPSLLPSTSSQPHCLLEMVRKPEESRYMNYKYRVKRLEIDVRRLMQGSRGSRPFRLEELVHELPRLQELQIIHPKQSPPYRFMKRATWQYPTTLFSDLPAETRLKTWRWTKDMVPAATRDDVFAFISQVHSLRPFEYLERLVVCDFDYVKIPAPMDEDAPPAKIPDLASAISTLAHLRDLTFISCDIIAEDFLEHIPRNLERLELSNCLEVTSDMLYTYLSLGGAQLRELVLNNNAALSLAFLEHLTALCPRLEVLKVDLTYYSERMNYNDALALYDHVLTVDQIPTWPSTLRHLEIVNLQKLEAEAAQNLFRSLVDSAAELRDLRHLALQAHINIPWRDRAGFRDQWIERLRRVYLRRSEDPNPNLMSLKQFRIWKGSQEDNVIDSRPQQSPRTPKTSRADVEGLVHRQMSHVRVTPRTPPTDAALYSDVGSPMPQALQKPPRRSVRVQESQSASTAAEESSSESESESAADNWRKQPEAFIQGLCNVVDIRIDNQRPRENQYTEANFLDSEPSGDEDWQSGQELSDDDRYAW